MIASPSTITIYNKKAADFIDATAVLQRLATGFRFTEGPCWRRDGCLLVSDMPANMIFKITPEGEKQVFKTESGFTGGDRSLLSQMVGSNAIAPHPDGSLLLCRQGNHAIGRLDERLQLSDIVTQYEGRPFNSPNELAVKKDGSFYFSDPPYGLLDETLYPAVFQPVAGIYYYREGEVKLVSDDFRYPNGLCLSDDETVLFAGSNHPAEPRLLRYPVHDDGSLGDPLLFMRQNADGIKKDKQGRLYLATNDGILIVGPDAERIALLPVPEMPTNTCFGGPGGDRLFITAGTSVYVIDLFE